MILSPSIGASLSLSASIPCSSSSALRVRCNFFRTIRLFPIGAPIREPIRSPKVADAIATACAPVTPASSTRGAMAADVPKPPISAVDPVISANLPSTPNGFANNTGIRFCSTEKTIARPRNLSNIDPPFFSNLRLTLNPIDVKKMVMKKLCNVLSNSMLNSSAE